MRISQPADTGKLPQYCMLSVYRLHFRTLPGPSVACSLHCKAHGSSKGGQIVSKPCHRYAQRSSARLAAAGVKTPQHPAVEAGTPKVGAFPLCEAKGRADSPALCQSHDNLLLYLGFFARQCWKHVHMLFPLLSCSIGRQSRWSHTQVIFLTGLGIAADERNRT